MSNYGSHFYPEDEDELDIRIHRQRSRSPAPVRYAEPQYRHTRPPYYESHSHGYVQGGGYLIPAVSGALHRSHSQGSRRRRTPSPPVQQAPQPVIINNKIYNERDDEEEYIYHHQLAPMRSHSRSHSHSRPSSFHSSREDWELEKVRKELAGIKLEKERQEEEKRIKARMELDRLRKEKEEEEEAERLKKAKEAAIEKYKAEQAERDAKLKKEKEEREKEYKIRMEEDLRKSGVDEKQIAIILKKEGANQDKGKVVDNNRPTYTRMSRRHLSIETLNVHRIDYEFDQDPEYVLIKRWVPEYEQDFLWTHTREVRERRKTVLLTIEGKKHHHHSEPEFEFVRKKKHERKPSPSLLGTFLMGGKR